MLGKIHLVGAFSILFGLTLSTVCVADVLGGPLTTNRRIAGVITAVDATEMTLTPIQGASAVTGRLDSAKTRVIIDGREGAVTDLHPAYTAKAQLGLDEVWDTVIVDSRR